MEADAEFAGRAGSPMAGHRVIGRYRAPELVAGGVTGTAADLYALGRTLRDALGVGPPGLLAPALVALLTDDPTGCDRAPGMVARRGLGRPAAAGSPGQ